jgi:hypothetical protein
MLCINWVRPSTDPLPPKVRAGAPLCIMNARVEASHMEPWPIDTQMPDAFAPSRIVHHAHAETIGFCPVRLCAKRPSDAAACDAAHADGAGGMGHLRPKFDELNERGASMRDTLSRFSGLAMELCHGRLMVGHPRSPTPQLTGPPPPLVAHCQEARTASHHPGSPAIGSSPSSSLALQPGDSSPRQTFLRGRIVDLLRATPAGLSQATIAAQCIAGPHPLADELLTEEDVGTALAALADTLVVYRNGERFCSL